MTTSADDPLDAPTAALAAAVLEVARHVGGQPLAAPRLFALARSAELLASSPGIAALLGIGEQGTDAPDALHLTPIDLEIDAPAGADPLAVLESADWPDLTAGGAITCDLAPQSWNVASTSPTDAGRRAPSSSDAPLGSSDAPLRVVVAALADGTTWSALHRGDEDGYVLGAALLPEITSALLHTLRERG